MCSAAQWLVVWRGVGRFGMLRPACVVKGWGNLLDLYSVERRSLDIARVGRVGVGSVVMYYVGMHVVDYSIQVGIFH